MRFAVAAASLALAGAASAAVLPRATEHKIYVDTSKCADNGRTLPQIYGISNSTSQDFTGPQRFDGPTFTFTVPAYYQGHLWLYDSDNQAASSGDNTPLNVQGTSFYFYDQPTDVEKNQATVQAEGSADESGKAYYVPDPITAVRFASTPSSDFIEGKTGGTLYSTTEGDALYVYYCEEWPVQN
ncbi:uncharacterized protein LTHEOB_12600 [Neofusicoccum parvum]|uniref:Uncharacterized protein LTHEOB_12600 n=1 Tax=Neofusicoccum parvum TaxID=310453 RepID=A0ACB5S9F8_9PEZI|nr:uncharacterized protein LTHEOB_12600 [Neofusicoccum parvum]